MISLPIWQKATMSVLWLWTKLELEVFFRGDCISLQEKARVFGGAHSNADDFTSIFSPFPYYSRDFTGGRRNVFSKSDRWRELLLLKMRWWQYVCMKRAQSCRRHRVCCEGKTQSDGLLNEQCLTGLSKQRDAALMDCGKNGYRCMAPLKCNQIWNDELLHFIKRLIWFEPKTRQTIELNIPLNAG